MKTRCGITILILLATAGFQALAHPPSEVSIEFNTKAKQLEVRVDHKVKDAKKHKIAEIKILVNENQVTVKKYESQMTPGGVKDLFKLDNVSPGDKIKVTATCSIAGEKSAEIVVKEEKKEEKEVKMLKKGQKAPNFILKDQDGKTVQLKKSLGKKNVVLVFYPGDGTPGCPKQLCSIRDEFSNFSDAETVVFGINPQGMDSHKKFALKYKFPFPLLVDKDQKTIKAYGAYGKNFTQRTVYGIDKKGIIVFAQRGMPPNSEILKAFQKEKKAKKPPR